MQAVHVRVRLPRPALQAQRTEGAVAVVPVALDQQQPERSAAGQAEHDRADDDRGAQRDAGAEGGRVRCARAPALARPRARGRGGAAWAGRAPRPHVASNPLPPGPAPAEKTTSSVALALTWSAKSNSVTSPPAAVPAEPSLATGGGSAPRAPAPAAMQGPGFGRRARVRRAAGRRARRRRGARL